MSNSDKNTHYMKSKKYKKHFSDFDLYKRDLSKMRLKKEIDKQEDIKFDNFKDMKKSSEASCDGNVNYKIYRPIYNFYKYDYQDRVKDHKNQLNSYQRIIDHLDEMMESGTLSENQLQNTKREQREILRNMDTIKNKITSITSVDSNIK